MAWLTAITGLLGAFSPLASIFGAGVGALVTYFVGQYIQRKQQQAAAVTSMEQDMDTHSTDGALSVSDMQSAQAQIQDLEQQAKAIDSQTPITISKGTP